MEAAFGSDLGQGSQVAGGFAVGETEESAGQFDDVSAGLTAGEAIPEVFGRSDDEGARIVSAVNRTGSGPTIAASFQGLEKTVGGKKSLDGDEAFEILEVQVRGDHGFLV